MELTQLYDLDLTPVNAWFVNVSKAQKDGKDSKRPAISQPKQTSM